GSYAEGLKSHPEQHSRVEFEEFRTALAKLPQDQREALLLVGASGFSYEEAAAICECAVGTIKSRVNRARTRLAELLSIDSADDFGPDQPTRAILSAGGHRGGGFGPGGPPHPVRNLPSTPPLRRLAARNGCRTRAVDGRLSITRPPHAVRAERGNAHGENHLQSVEGQGARRCEEAFLDASVLTSGGRDIEFYRKAAGL